jgi:hypothetical protein
MTLADLIDLEAQLARDRDADPTALAARDRKLLPPPHPGSRAVLLRAWIAARRAADPGELFPGAAFAAALRWTGTALGLLGLGLGWAAATAVLGYTGAHPVNVWDVLLAFVGVQLLLLGLLVATFLLPLAAFGAPLASAARGLAAALHRRLAARALGPARAAAWSGLWHRLRARRSLYHHVEPWLALGLTQRFGVLFNVGALLGFLRVIAFSDVAFGWGTTLLELSPARFHALVQALAAPWRAFWPDAVPSLALVEATRYSRLEGAYLLSGAGRAARPELVGGWWPFLVAALACYGLAPRAALLALASWRSRRLLARLPLDDAELSRLAARLASPSVETRALAPEAATPSPAAGPGPSPAPAPAPGGRCAVVRWRDAPLEGGAADAVARQAGAAVAAVHAAGGRDCEEAGRDWAAALRGLDPVVVVAEAFEAPDRAAVRLLGDLRRAVGPRRQLLVLLSAPGGTPGPARRDLETWREGLAPLADPFLAVEPLGVAA